MPMTRAVVGAVGGAMLVVIGFMLPWNYVQLPEMFGSVSAVREGYQAGYNVGFLGWLILSLGVLPALLACVPALDVHLRRAMLRLVLACAGLAFAIALAVQAVAGNSAPGAGLIIVLLGFGLQLLSALQGAGLMRRGGARAGA